MALVQTAGPRSPVFAEVARAPAEPPDAYWSHPDAGLRASAYGVAEVREGDSLRAVLASLESPDGLPEGMPGPWFGAAAFAGALGPDWKGFAPLRFTLPELLSWTHRGRHYLAAFGERPEQRLSAARRRLDAPVRPQSSPASVRVVARPGERARWDAVVSQALKAIAAETLQKVVLARAIEAEAARPLDPAAVLRALETRYPSCRSFLVRGGGAAFVGATPEILCRMDGDRIEADALAGSAPPSQAEALLASAKDRAEHLAVVDHIVSAFRGVAEHVDRSPAPAVRVLANVAHLYTPVRARLAPGRSIADAVAALHPTPAVGGAPVAAALRFLAEHESLDRGLYAGVVGWVGPERAELAVALRSALLRGRTARIFAGAGIVEGSSPAAEWEETELKARALLDALGAAP